MGKLRRAAAAVSALLLLTGCSGSNVYSKFRDVADIELIRTMGVYVSRDGEISVIAEAGSGRDGKSPGIYTASAGSFASATEKMRTMSAGKETFFAHTENLLISENTDADEICALLDYVARATEMRIDTDIFILKGASASDMLLGVQGGDTSVSDMLSFLKKNSAKNGLSFPTSCRSTVSDLLTCGTALISAVRLEKSGNISESGGEFMPASAGFAVLTEGGPVCFLTEKESRGAVILKNRLKYETLDILTDAGMMTLGITDCQTELFPEYENGTLKALLVRVKAKSGVTQTDGRGGPPEDEEARLLTARAAADVISECVTEALRRAQTMKTDFAGIGEALERKNPVKFSAVKPNWGELFPDIPISVEVMFAIERTYDLVSSIVGKP